MVLNLKGIKRGRIKLNHYLCEWMHGLSGKGREQYHAIWSCYSSSDTHTSKIPVNIFQRIDKENTHT